MIQKKDLSEVGHIIKTHGIYGEVIISTEIELDPEVFAFLFIEIHGNIIPFQLEEFRWTRNDAGILKLADMSEKEAKELVGSSCFVVTSAIVHEELEATAFSMEGFKLYNTDHLLIGTVISIDKQSSNLLFVVEQTNGKEILIPVAEEYLVELNADKKQIILNLPDGLLELYQ